MSLENKFNITEPIELAKTEEKISKQKTKQLFDSGTSAKPKPTPLRACFYPCYLFEDIDIFAGKIRDVNMAMNFMKKLLDRVEVEAE